MSTHTPGPWRFEYENADFSGGGCWYSIKGPDGDLFWYPYNGPRSGGEREEANARLAAAAPELLEALTNLFDCSPCQNGCAANDMSCASNAARAAIAKATQP